MVVNDNASADVVFIIEATAHISPYVESLKTNYIIPTLECFSGSLSEERDLDSDGNINCALYGIVTFMSMDCKPDSASACYAPTASSCTFLQWLDKIQFIGGAGDPSSHIVEGLSTAISLIDHFQSLRDKNRSDIQKSNSSKYCILICNSTPYMEPSNENPIYCGYTIEQLMNVMAKKNINFSIFSPRKMKFLYKLFESAGGSLSNALSKNYAKDRRHLVLLNGFHLQEKPMSPTSQPPSTEQDKSQQQQQGIKRTLSPSSNTGLTSQQIMTRNQQMNSLMAGDASHSMITSDNMTLQSRVGSPSLTHWPGNGNVPPQAARNPNHSTVRARTGNLPINSQNINPSPSPSQLSNFVSQSSPAPKQSPVNPNNVNLRPSNPIRPQQSFSTPQAPSPSQPQPSPLGMRAVPSPIQNSTPSPISQPQQFIQQQISSNSQPHLTQISQTTLNVPNMTSSSNSPMPSGLMNNQRTRIWAGLIEYHDKTPPINSQSKYLLECQMTYQPNNNEPDLTADHWPDKLMINTVPKGLVTRLSPIFRTNSYQVNFHFQNESPGLQKLLKAMNSNSVGCIQMTNPAKIRIIIVFYTPEKKLFIGFIPHNQDEFVTSMREIIESHKKEQQVKQQQMLNHMQIQQQQQQQIQQQSHSPLHSNQVANTNQPQVTQMSGPMSIQIMHGQMGQGAHSNNSQIITSSNANTMFQLQQISTVPSNVNSNVNTVAQAVSMPSNSSVGTNIAIVNQAKPTTFIANSANMVTTSNAINIINSSTVTSMNQMQQPNQQGNITTQMIQPQNPQQQQQQFNMIATSGQINIVKSNNSNIGANGPRPFLTNDREQNLMAIKQLEENLKEAHRKEMEYQQQQTVNPVDQPPNPQQMLSNSLQMQNGAVIRQQLQQQLYQKQQLSQMQQQQQQQQQQQHQANTNSQSTGSTNNAQLRHLLQKQHLRSINPNRMHLQTGTVTQQGQQPIMLQGGQMAQQQQFRFQTTMQGGQQQQQPTPTTSVTQAQQQHRSNFFDDTQY